MDQTTAKRLLAEGAFFIFLDVPEGTEFGIDMKSWNTGEKFRGVKMIPPGIHYIFYSSVSLSDDIAPRVGFFHNFKKGELLAKKWDKKTEQISTEPVLEAAVVGFKENILAMDEFLGPYPYDILDKWVSLSSNITDNILEKLTPLSGRINSALELQSCSDKDRPRGTAKTKSSPEPCSSQQKKQRLSDNVDDLLPNLKPVEGTALRLTNFPNKNYPEGAPPSDITRHSLDSTYVFEAMLAQYSNPNDILAEIEFCYICFLVGHSLEAFDQWKKFVTLFCSCDLAISKYRKLFDRFLALIEIHIKEVPEEFLADIVSNNNFVYVNLRKLFRTIQSSSMDGQLKTKAERLKNALTNIFSWDFGHLESEEDDEAPVVVKM